MPKTYVEKSITINASTEKVKTIISDFNHWRHWSPWLILEPDATVKVTKDGKKQEWDGKRIGSGEISVANEKETEINYDLLFLKPWKSKAKTDFIVEALTENSTRLTWSMHSTLPFFMFWMKTMMERMIGMDYDRGLLMLKDYIENDKVAAHLEFLGESDYAGCKYIGIKNTCSLDDVGEVMEADFEKLAAFAKENGELLTDEWFTIYHKFDFNKNKVVYTGGIGVKETPGDLEQDFILGTIPATKMQTVRHIGPYELSGNGWSAIMAMERAKEFKQNKKVSPIEFYRNDPRETDPNDLISDICMAVK
ncbi:SRPBCC family protein [uncultured Draconibacterium sp.]|uniref:SRPBCC family protein n=1 Tax=uncultured Draconibacterium sp. TaxID=1573823 RepID=UPI0025E03AB6|nr:SRPBCC family protein [uncultured Draconibacterium sp.]